MKVDRSTVSFFSLSTEQFFCQQFLTLCATGTTQQFLSQTLNLSSLDFSDSCPDINSDPTFLISSTMLPGVCPDDRYQCLPLRPLPSTSALMYVINSCMLYNNTSFLYLVISLTLWLLTTLLATHLSPV